VQTEEARDRLETLAERLAERPPAVRDRYLAMLRRSRPDEAELLARLLAWFDRLDEGRQAERELFRLGRFRALQRIGGSLAPLWLAIDEGDDRIVALKCASGAGDARLRARRRIGREVRASAALCIRGVPRCVAAGTIDGVDYLCRDYVAGACLADWVAQRRLELHDGHPPAAAELLGMLGLVERVAGIVAEVHAAGWVHGDLKPANVVIGLDAVPRLIDFGCAVRAGEPAPDAGSPAYLAPERIRVAGPRAAPGDDVWSLGVMLFECVALRLPFVAEGRAGLLHRIATSAAPELEEVAPWAPPGIGALVAWALERDAARRCPDAGTFAAELGRLSRAEPTRSARRRAAQRRRRRGLRIGVALGLAIWWATSGATDRGPDEPREPVDLPGSLAWVAAAEREAAGLWPAWPELAERFEAWRRAHLVPLSARRDAITAELQTATDARRAELEAAGRRLADFLDAPGGACAMIEERASKAEALAERSLIAAAELWRAAIGRTAAHPDFGGLRLEPMVDLVPLGPDLDSGLEEFHHPASATPGHPEPVRGEKKRLVLDADHGLVFVLVPGGRFWMGEQADDPNGPNFDPLARLHRSPEQVELGPFLLSKFELTRGQWLRLGGPPLRSNFAEGQRHGSDPPIGPQHPRDSLSFEAAITALARHGLDLPTEAQWEWAAVGPAGRWPHRERLEELSRFANVRDQAFTAMHGPSEGSLAASDGHAGPAEVGSFLPNRFGFHDLAGNLAEWCRDGFAPYGPRFPPRPGDGLRTPNPPGHRMLRGGSFEHLAIDTRPANRSDFPPESRLYFAGVRPLRPLGRTGGRP
jgi:formylglycine-generating enzyme required for sulfatase activity